MNPISEHRLRGSRLGRAMNLVDRLRTSADERVWLLAGVQHISLNDIYMSFKLYVTCICCIIRNTIQIHHKPSSTYIYIQQSIVFGHLLLHIHYLMADHLDSALWRPGSQRFAPFLVRLLVFRSRDVTGPWAAVRLVCNVCMCECVCMCLQFGLYTMPTPFLFLSQTLSKNLIRFTTLGGLCSI